ncbi:MAG: helix-turn-helix domain-containing protein [Spirochaetota bacterium]
MQSHERDEIAIMLADGYTNANIAKFIERHQSTMTREIKGNGTQIGIQGPRKTLGFLTPLVAYKNCT